MNNFTTTVIIGWQTRNAKRHQKALTWCKDYGLVPVLPSLCIGKLYAKEEKSLLNKFKQSFILKTDAVFSTRVCESCSASMDADARAKQKANIMPEFELIQFETTPSSIRQKSKKPRK